MKKEEAGKVVRDGYAQVAKSGSSCCAPQSPCCGTANIATEISKKIGYTQEGIYSQFPKELTSALAAAIQ